MGESIVVLVVAVVIGTVVFLSSVSSTRVLLQLYCNTISGRQHVYAFFIPKKLMTVVPLHLASTCIDLGIPVVSQFSNGGLYPLTHNGARKKIENDWKRWRFSRFNG